MNLNARSAIAAGSVAGSIMLGCLMAAAEYGGNRWDAPLRWIAAALGALPVLIDAGQARGGIGPAGVMTVGLVIHLIVSSVWGWVFFRLVFDILPSLRGWRLAVTGLIYGAAVWAFMAFCALRLFDATMHARVRLLPVTFLAVHLLYGAALAAYARSTQAGNSEK
jgi:hypothetical protein